MYDSGTAMFHDTMIYDLKNPYFQDSRNIKAKPFASNQKEQMDKIPYKEYCSNLNLKKLVGIPDFFKELISENPYIENERAELLRNILFARIKETENLLH